MSISVREASKMSLYSMDFDPMTSLFSEEPSSLLALGHDDFLKGQGSLEPGDYTGNLADDLLGELDGRHSRGSSLSEELPDWMSEKISLTQWIDAADIMPSDLLTDVPLSFPKDASLEPAEDLLLSLMVDDNVPPQPPSPGEQQALDLVALSPAGCLSSPESPMSPALSLSNTDPESPEAIPLTAEEQLWQIAEGLTTIYGKDLTEEDQSEFISLQPQSPPAESFLNPSPSPEQQFKEEDQKRYPVIPQKKSRAKPKLKTVSDPVVKKSKKRDQNKVAATRYRQKKRSEANTIASQEEELEGRNKELKDKVDSLSREIKYLKDLMAEVFKVKGELKILQK